MDRVGRLRVAVGMNIGRRLFGNRLDRLVRFGLSGMILSYSRPAISAAMSAANAAIARLIAATVVS